MTRKASIYALRDSEKNIRYIGKTVDIEGRIYHHRRERSWFFDFILIEEIDESIWQEREIFWIKFFRELGCKLENLTDGGEGPVYGRACSEETRKKIANSLRGVKHTPERTEKIAAALRGRKPSEETIEKIKASVKNYIRTEQHCQNLSKSLKGKSTLKTPEAKENHRRALTGRQLSDEHIDNIRRSMILRYENPEARRLTSETTKAGKNKQI